MPGSRIAVVRRSSAPPGTAYELVGDVTWMGEWGPGRRPGAHDRRRMVAALDALAAAAEAAGPGRTGKAGA